MDNLRTTIEPKSDQINADDLLSGPMTVKITAVKKGPANEQPVQIEIEGHRPYRPCKSMRRVLIACWGDKGSDWIGREMTLYADPAVKYGGVAVGGIRISHVSHMDRPELKMMLTTTRSRRSEYCVKRLEVDQINQQIANYKTEINTAENMNQLKTIGNQIKKADKEIQSAVRDAYMAKMEALKPDPKAETKTVKNEVVDKDTGEVTEQTDDAPTLDEVMRLITTASTSPQLDESCDMIQLLPKKDQATAIKAAQAKRAELNK